jgi:hypothetical protein
VFASSSNSFGSNSYSDRVEGEASGQQGATSSSTAIGGPSVLASSGGQAQADASNYSGIAPVEQVCFICGESECTRHFGKHVLRSHSDSTQWGSVQLSEAYGNATFEYNLCVTLSDGGREPRLMNLNPSLLLSHLLKAILPQR